MHVTTIVPYHKNAVETYTESAAPPKKSWYTHIDGIRGLAILLVVIFHVFVGKVSSGVDVFLFLGGIFLLSSQMKNAFNTEGMSLTQSLIRLIRRLYPALILVASVTGIVGLFAYSSVRWESLLKDMAASVTYWINFRLWANGNDYATAGEDPSPFQHLWSMSVQIQIYVFIIVLVTIIGAIKKRDKRGTIPYEKIAVSIVGVLSIASFIYAWWLGNNDQSLNYYSPLSRFWEIGAGALFGHLLINRVILPYWVRIIFSFVGLGAILLTGVFLDGASQFPGPWTLIPILGAAMLVSAGQTNRHEKRGFLNIGLVWLLETKLARELGKMAYSLYLWHWPLLILSITIFEEESWEVGVIVIAASLGLAYLTRRFVEEPFRQKIKPTRVTIMDMVRKDYFDRILRNTQSLFQPIGAVAMIVVTAFVVASPGLYMAGTSIQANMQDREIEERGGIDVLYPGAGEFLNGDTVELDLPIFPDTGDLDMMMPATQEDECFTDFEGIHMALDTPDGDPCLYGDTESSEVLYLIGGSHSEHYLSALSSIGQSRGFAVRPIIKMGCAPYHDTLYNGEEFPECITWSDALVQYVIDNPPSMGIFMTGTRPESISGKGPEIVPQDYINVVQQFSDNGIHSWLIRDNPWIINDPTEESQRDVRACVNDTKLDDDAEILECGQQWDWTMSEVDPQLDAYAGIENVTLMDASAAYVRDNYVYPVVGGILVYRDTHHLTQQFVNTMAPYLESLMFPNPEVSEGDQPANQLEESGPVVGAGDYAHVVDNPEIPMISTVQ